MLGHARCRPIGKPRPRISVAPLHAEKDFATLQLDVLREKLALTALVTYDFEANEYGIEMPLYLIVGLNGGVSVGWTSEEQRSAMLAEHYAPERRRKQAAPLA